MAIRALSRRLTPVGAAGSAAVSVDIGVPPSQLLGVMLDYTTLPATTDVTVTNMGRALLTRTNVNADGMFMAKEGIVDATGTAIANGVDYPLVHGNVTVAVAQADPIADGLAVILFIRD
jgi:hypothetical protein